MNMATIHQRDGGEYVALTAEEAAAFKAMCDRAMGKKRGLFGPALVIAVVATVLFVAVLCGAWWLAERF